MNETLFDLNSPEIPDASTVKDSLPVGQLNIGDTIHLWGEQVVITAIRDSFWRFSEYPKRFLVCHTADGRECAGSFHPAYPIENNAAQFWDGLGVGRKSW